MLSVCKASAVTLVYLSLSTVDYSGLGNCDKFYFTFEFKVQMWVWIYQIFERDQIPIHNLSNKLNPNTNKQKGWVDQSCKHSSKLQILSTDNIHTFI
jgi:hypothetical protein